MEPGRETRLNHVCANRKRMDPTMVNPTLWHAKWAILRYSCCILEGLLASKYYSLPFIHLGEHLQMCGVDRGHRISAVKDAYV